MVRLILLIVFLSNAVDVSVCQSDVNLDEGDVDTSQTTTPDDDQTIDQALESYQTCKLAKGGTGYCLPYYLCTNGVGKPGDIIPKKAECLIADEDPYLCCSKEPARGCGMHHLKTPNFEPQANIAEFPWSVALFSLNMLQDLQNVNGYFCGGSLIHTGVVLSAASCFINRQATEVVALVGGWDLSDESVRKNAVPVSDIMRHELYSDGTYFSNIALLFLKKQVILGPTIGTICLPESNADEPNDLQCLATGWGRNQQSVYPNIMQVLKMKMTQRDICERHTQMSFGNVKLKLSKNLLCATTANDNCSADRGSPLICQVEGNDAVYIQYGILSIGTNCGRRPAQYTKISAMRNWIDKKIIQHKYSTGNYTYKP